MKRHPVYGQLRSVGTPMLLRNRVLRDALVRDSSAVRSSLSRFSPRPGMRLYLPSGYRMDLRHEQNSDAVQNHWWETELRIRFRPLKPIFLHVAPENALTRGKPDWLCGDPELDERYMFRARQPEVLQALFSDERFREQFRSEDQLRLFRAMPVHRLVAHDNLPRRSGAMALLLKQELQDVEAFAQRMVLLLRAAQVLQARRWIAPLYDAEGRRAW